MPLETTCLANSPGSKSRNEIVDFLFYSVKLDQARHFSGQFLRRSSIPRRRPSPQCTSLDTSSDSLGIVSLAQHSVTAATALRIFSRIKKPGQIPKFKNPSQVNKNTGCGEACWAPAPTHSAYAIVPLAQHSVNTVHWEFKSGPDRSGLCLCLRLPDILVFFLTFLITLPGRVCRAESAPPSIPP